MEILEQWRNLIGLFFVSFAKIEHTTCISIKAFSEENISNTANSLPFTLRVELLMEIIVKKKYIESEKLNKLLNLLKQSLKLSEKRNIIAHNPILLDIYTDESEQLKEREVIVSKRNCKKRIHLEDLKKMVDEANKLSEELHDSYFEILPYILKYNRALMWEKHKIINS